ncbi:hypothetical protein [Streptomyces endophyticus]|uniref:Lactonase family protein n=1 Tax=Streptomyces endophyticus TaxID=714166 RepID=A0ABU6FA14_9ACTN|nr:hypothetical protein [Streptomyces endophyticus]MEB8340866.1 hypothetical protein [Streptomyces endophyticus]
MRGDASSAPPAPGSSEPRLLPTGDGPLSIALSANGRTAHVLDKSATGPGGEDHVTRIDVAR